MTTIKSTHGLRIAYEELSWWELCLRCNEYEPHVLQQWKERIAEQKRAIRRYTHRETDGRYVICDKGDYAVVVIPMPEDFSREDAEEWFQTREAIEAPNSPYDCTGAMFTSWHSVLRRAGRWYIYHGVALDV